MDTTAGQGTITVQAQSKMVIKVDETITITLSGETGVVKVEAQQINVEASSQVSVKTDGILKLEGAQVTEKASSMHRIESGGVVTIGGNPIKIG